MEDRDHVRVTTVRDAFYVFAMACISGIRVGLHVLHEVGAVASGASVMSPSCFVSGKPSCSLISLDVS